MASRRGRSRSRARNRRSPLVRALRVVVVVAVLVGIGLGALRFFWPQTEIAADAQALARVKLPPVGERLSAISVTDDNGRRIAVTVRGGKLRPVGKVAAG